MKMMSFNGVSISSKNEMLIITDLHIKVIDWETHDEYIMQWQEIIDHIKKSGSNVE